VLRGTIDALDAADRFDAILFIHVLEHIADDRKELNRAAEHLATGGNLVVLGPDHQFLFSPFDSVILGISGGTAGPRSRRYRLQVTNSNPVSCSTR
jgi:2-polyprenyl-3-methyl-5-hydroxy-6-metoxy-1,4-benzoquinol methylase